MKNIAFIIYVFVVVVWCAGCTSSSSQTAVPSEVTMTQEEVAGRLRPLVVPMVGP